ncbi:MAG: hypothetical protein ABWY26_01575 [Microbacterium sp.]
MAETFYGPWRVVLMSANSHFAQQLVVAGSDNADGEYVIAFGQVLDIAVQGEQWQLQTQFFPFGGPAWENGAMRAVSRFDLDKGLLVQVDAASRPPGAAGGTFSNASLLCSSLDPETNPLPGGMPPDFTVPGE